MTKNIFISCLIYLLAIFLLKCLIRPQGIFIAENTENASNGQISAINGVLDKLSFCESSNNPLAYVHNDGGSPSKGLFQFKKTTFSLYWKSLINKDLDQYDLENIWGDPEAQRQLAEAMLLDNPKNLRHWKVCTTRYSLMQELVSALPAKNTGN